MTVVLLITSGLLGLASLLSLIRLLRGPTDHDRMMSLDTLVVIAVSEIAVIAALRDQSADITPLVAVTLVAFLSTVSVLRLIADQS